MDARNTNEKKMIKQIHVISLSRGIKEDNMNDIPSLKALKLSITESEKDIIGGGPLYVSRVFVLVKP